MTAFDQKRASFDTRKIETFAFTRGNSKMSTIQEQNKKNAQAFYDLMFNQCQPGQAVEKYVGDEYVQHNPAVADGIEAFVEYFDRMNAEYPGKKVHFKQCNSGRQSRRTALPPGVAGRQRLRWHRHFSIR